MTHHDNSPFSTDAAMDKYDSQVTHVYRPRGKDQFYIRDIQDMDDSEGSDNSVMTDDISASDLLIQYRGNDLYIGLKVDGNSNITAFPADFSGHLKKAASI